MSESQKQQQVRSPHRCCILPCCVHVCSILGTVDHLGLVRIINLQKATESDLGNAKISSRVLGKLASLGLQTALEVLNQKPMRAEPKAMTFIAFKLSQNVTPHSVAHPTAYNVTQTNYICCLFVSNHTQICRINVQVLKTGDDKWVCVQCGAGGATYSYLQ